MIALRSSFKKENYLLISFMSWQRRGEIKYFEAECVKIDAANKNVFVRANTDTTLVGNPEFSLEYDYLVIALGAQVNTFNTPGVEENCHFLKVESVHFHAS